MIAWLRRLERRTWTDGGRILAVVSAVSLIVGMDTNRTQLDGLFTLAVSLMLVGLPLGLSRRLRPSGDWSLPPRATAGVSLRALVQLTNPTRRTQTELDATLDRVPRGLRLHPIGASARCLRLPPGESARLEIELTAARRGAYQVGPAYVGTTWPFGILRLGRCLGSARTLLVTPRVHPILSLALSPGLRYQPGGVPLASQTGESLEFVGVRDYRPGDSMRKLHWKLWARRGQPVVREYSQEYFSRVGVILDTYRPPSPKLFEAAVEVAASAAGFLSRQDAIVDFFAAGPSVYFLSIGRHLGSLQAILDVLACVGPCRQSPYARLQSQLMAVLPKLSAVLVISFAPNPERREFLERLRLAGTPLRVLCIGPGEGELNPANFPGCLEHL